MKLLLHGNKKRIALIMLIGLFKLPAYSEGRVPLELFVTNKKNCRYIDMIRPTNAEIRKRSTVHWDGNCVNGYVSGYGTLQILQPDGKTQVFKGNYLNGLEDGPFEMRQEHNGRVVQIQGIWKGGTPQTASIQITGQNGRKTTYKGELQDGQYSGQGEITYEDGTVYRGSFADNQPHGFGRASLADGRTYEGEHLKGVPSGRGKWQFQDGTVYEGDVQNATPHGKGRMIWTNGDTYDGDFESGIRTGIGVYRWRSGRVYEGEFKNNKVEGRGKYIEKNSDVAEGETRDGKLQGNWIVTKANNQKYLVEYKDGTIINQSTVNNEITGSSTTRAPDLAKRQQGMDHMYCEQYARQSIAGLKPAIPPGPPGAGTALAGAASVLMITSIRDEAYSNCMKNLGW